MRSSLCKNFLVVLKHSNIYLGLVQPSGGWQSLIAWLFFNLVGEDVYECSITVVGTFEKACQFYEYFYYFYYFSIFQLLINQVMCLSFLILMILDDFLLTLDAFLMILLINFWSIFDQFLINFWSIFDQFLINFWSIFDQFLINFWSIFDAQGMPIGCL